MITIYTRQGCAPCRTLKYWLGRKGIEYKEVAFEDRPQDYPQGFSIFPLIKIGDEFVQGLNFQRLNSLI